MTRTVFSFAGQGRQLATRHGRYGGGLTFGTVDFSRRGDWTLVATPRRSVDH